MGASATWDTTFLFVVLKIMENYFSASFKIVIKESFNNTYYTRRGKEKQNGKGKGKKEKEKTHTHTQKSPPTSLSYHKEPFHMTICFLQI